MMLYVKEQVQPDRCIILSSTLNCCRFIILILLSTGRWSQFVAETCCRVITAVKRFSKAEEQPSEAEEALLFWVNQSLHALRFTSSVKPHLGEIHPWLHSLHHYITFWVNKSLPWALVFHHTDSKKCFGLFCWTSYLVDFPIFKHDSVKLSATLHFN